MSVINWEIGLDLSCPKYFIISEMSIAATVAGDDLVVVAETTSATCQTNSTKFYVLVVTLSENSNIKCLENFNQGF